MTKIKGLGSVLLGIGFLFTVYCVWSSKPPVAGLPDGNRVLATSLWWYCVVGGIPLAVGLFFLVRGWRALGANRGETLFGLGTLGAGSVLIIWPALYITIGSDIVLLTSVMVLGLILLLWGVKVLFRLLVPAKSI